MTRRRKTEKELKEFEEAKRHVDHNIAARRGRKLYVDHELEQWAAHSKWTEAARVWAQLSAPNSLTAWRIPSPGTLTPTALSAIAETGIATPDATGKIRMCFTPMPSFVGCAFDGTLAMGDASGTPPGQTASVYYNTFASLARLIKSNGMCARFSFAGNIVQSQGIVGVGIHYGPESTVPTTIAELRGLRNSYVTTVNDLVQHAICQPALPAKQTLVETLTAGTGFAEIPVTGGMMELHSIYPLINSTNTPRQAWWQLMPHVFFIAEGMDVNASILINQETVYEYIPVNIVADSQLPEMVHDDAIHLGVRAAEEANTPASVARPLPPGPADSTGSSAEANEVAVQARRFADYMFRNGIKKEKAQRIIDLATSHEYPEVQAEAIHLFSGLSEDSADWHFLGRFLSTIPLSKHSTVHMKASHPTTRSKRVVRTAYGAAMGNKTPTEYSGAIDSMKELGDDVIDAWSDQKTGVKAFDKLLHNMGAPAHAVVHGAALAAEKAPVIAQMLTKLFL